MFLVSFLSIIFLFLAAMIFLPDTGVCEHGFVFVDGQYQNLATVLVCTIPVILAVLVNRLPKSSFKTVMKCFVIPSVVCSVLVATASILMMAFPLPSLFHCSVVPVKSVDGVGIRLLYLDYPSKFDDNDGLCILRLERDVFANILREYKYLAVVDPAPGATIEFLDNGAKVKLVVPYHYSLIPINRVFSTDWLANASKPCLRIDRTF